MKVVSRKDALLAGSKRYFTGKPCKRGHVAERSVRSYYCIPCQYENSAKWFTKWYATHSKEFAIRQRRYPSRTVQDAQRVRRKGRNLAAQREGRARRRACLRNQVCQCCTPKQRTVWYAKAKMVGATVDHIIPTAKGGLHCAHNMQLLSRPDISRKGARYDPLVEGAQYLRNLGL